MTITASLPPGRGYGTSTADIGAALSAASQACGAPLSPVQLSRIAVMVEPTDSTLFPGLTLFDHRSGDFYETLGPAPQAVVVVLDPGGEVDTEAFNHLDHTPVLRSLATEHRQAFDLLRDAIGRADLVALGEACTLDARLHQRVLPNPLLDAACCVAAETGAVGVCRAHSGTLLGLLFHPAQFDPGRLRRSVSSRIPASVALSVTRLSGGGAQVHGLPVEYPKADVRCP